MSVLHAVSTKAASMALTLLRSSSLRDMSP